MLLVLPFVQVSPDDANDPHLPVRGALYAIVDARTRTLVYIGIADACTLKQRLFDKKKLAILRKYPRNSLAVFCAVPRGLQGGPARRSKLLKEAEGILIFEEQPRENVQSRNSCWNKYGLRIVCEGTWYGSSHVYHPDSLVFDELGFQIS